MAELTTAADTTVTSCCAPEAQATCCEPSAKADCCDPSHGEGCGCVADTTTQSGHIPARVPCRSADALSGKQDVDEMLALARESARKAGVENVEFH